jgi:hypothetical protein
MYKTRVSPYAHTGISFRSLSELREFLTSQGFSSHADGFQKQIPEGVVIATFYGDGEAWFIAMKCVPRLQYHERRFADEGA